MFLFYGYLIVISAISVFVCCYDKAVAKKGKRRVSEKTLINLSIMGGAMAMYITMCLIRHKTRHIKFMLGLPVIIVVQTAVILIILKNMA